MLKKIPFYNCNKNIKHIHFNILNLFKFFLHNKFNIGYHIPYNKSQVKKLKSKSIAQNIATSFSSTSVYQLTNISNGAIEKKTKCNVLESKRISLRKKYRNF